MQNAQVRIQRFDAGLTEASRGHDRFSNEACASEASLRSIYSEQADQKEMIRNLAQQIEELKGGTHPDRSFPGQGAATGSTPPESSQLVAVAMQELRQKVTRLIDQVDQNTGELGSTLT